MHRFLLAFHVAILSLGCGTAAPRELSDLVIVDSVYVDPASMEAFTGAVVRHPRPTIPTRDRAMEFCSRTHGAARTLHGAG